MPTISPGLITHAEIIVYGTIASGGSNGKNTVNLFHYRRNNNTAPLDKTALVNQFSPVVLSKMAACLNARWSCHTVTCRWMDDATDPPFPISIIAPGSVTGDSMPMRMIAYLTKSTGYKGKHYRGNSKMGPLSESDTTSGTDDLFNAAALTRWNALAGAMITPLNDAGPNQWIPCLYSRRLSQPLINPTNIVTTDLSQILVRKTFGSMKKRYAKSVY